MIEQPDPVHRRAGRAAGVLLAGAVALAGLTDCARAPRGGAGPTPAAAATPPNVAPDDAPPAQADGRITRVDGDAVTIDLGAGDRVTPGMTFEVHDGERPSGWAGKASIEVLRLGPSGSKCRVIRLAPGHAIAAGDAIANLVYDRGKVVDVVLAGAFDFDGDGQAPEPGAELLRRITTQWGGRVQPQVTTDTDVVVLGDGVPPGVRADARAVGATVLTQSEFVQAVGYAARIAEVAAAAGRPSELITVALHARVGELHTRGRTFGAVIDVLRDDTGQNIFVNWKALAPARVTRDLPVTTDLSGLTLAGALDKLLAEIGGTQAFLGYTVDDGVVTISTRADLARNTLTRVYDVRKAIPDPATRDRDLAALVARLRGIDPLSWREAGGTSGAWRELQGNLIVTQSPEVHRRIQEELADVLADGPQFPLRSTRVSPRTE